MRQLLQIYSSYYNFVLTKRTKTLPTESQKRFQASKYPTKCVCGRKSAPEPVGSSQRSQTPSWIRERKGRDVREGEGREKEGRGKKVKGKKGREDPLPKLKVWLRSLYFYRCVSKFHAMPTSLVHSRGSRGAAIQDNKIRKAKFACVCTTNLERTTNDRSRRFCFNEQFQCTFES